MCFGSVWVKGPALDSAKPTETSRYKPIQKVLVLYGFLNLGVFHRVPKYSPHAFTVRFSIVRLRAVDRSRTWLNPEPAPPSRFTPNAPASTASSPASMTMANAPLWDWTAGDIDSSRVTWKQEYFLKQGWTGQITLSRFNKLPRWRKRAR
jgi:hypothetical protein